MNEQHINVTFGRENGHVYLAIDADFNGLVDAAMMAGGIIHWLSNDFGIPEGVIGAICAKTAEAMKKTDHQEIDMSAVAEKIGGKNDG